MKLQAYEYNGTIQKNQLYYVNSGNTIIFEELQEDKSVDRVICRFCGNSETYFCMEYRPAQIPKCGHKAADIMVTHMGEVACIHIYDAKRQFGNDDEIFKFVMQVNTTYMDTMALALMAGYENEKQRFRIGVFTSEFAVDEIISQKNYYYDQLVKAQKELSSKSVAIKKKAALNISDLKRKASILSSIINKRVMMQDKQEFDMDVQIMHRVKDGFCCDITFNEW